MLHIMNSLSGTTLTVKLQGYLDMSTADILESNFNGDLNSTTKKVALILDELDFIDSTGVGTLLKLYRKLVGNGIDLEIICNNFEIEEVLEIIGLREILEQLL